MSTAVADQSRIAFIDLAAQRDRIRGELDRAIARVLDHGQFIMGPEVATLERELAAFTGARHALSCASGTDALLMAMMALDVRRGDAVLCPAFTYTATPETIVLLGASPVFIEVDERTFNVDPARIGDGVAAARRIGLNPVGMIAVDLFGLPAPYERIEEEAGRHGLWVLADAAQSFGASRSGRRVGTFGRIAATSFFPAKPLGCYGDGGALFSDDDRLAEVLASIRLHGKGADKYDVVRLGINGRLDTLQAAVLIEKLRIFPDEVERRQAIAHRYTSALSDRVITPTVDNASRSVFAQYTLRLPRHRDTVAAGLAKAGIPTQIYYPRPLHHQPAYRDFPVADGGLAIAERLSREVLSLPMHPYLGERDQDHIIAALRTLLDRD